MKKNCGNCRYHSFITSELIADNWLPAKNEGATLKGWHLYVCPKCDGVTTCQDNTDLCGLCGYDPARPKRKELEAQLATANAEINRLKVELSVCQQRHKIRDGILTTANAELESMHRELAAKDAEIAEWKRIHAILKKDQLALYKNRTRIIEDLNAKQAIINEQKREITQLRMWLRLYEWGGGL